MKTQNILVAMLFATTLIASSCKQNDGPASEPIPIVEVTPAAGADTVTLTKTTTEKVQTVGKAAEKVAGNNEEKNEREDNDKNDNEVGEK